MNNTQEYVALMNECYAHCNKLWTETDQPVHNSEIMRFLSTRCSTEKALRVLELMCEAGWLLEFDKTELYYPKARSFTASV
jgi:pentatricopeptide repeat protein